MCRYLDAILPASAVFLIVYYLLLQYLMVEIFINKGYTLWRHKCLLKSIKNLLECGTQELYIIAGKLIAIQPKMLQIYKPV